MFASNLCFLSVGSRQHISDGATAKVAYAKNVSFFFQVTSRGVRLANLRPPWKAKPRTSEDQGVKRERNSLSQNTLQKSREVIMKQCILAWLRPRRRSVFLVKHVDFIMGYSHPIDGNYTTVQFPIEKSLTMADHSAHEAQCQQLRYDSLRTKQKVTCAHRVHTENFQNSICMIYVCN